MAVKMGKMSISIPDKIEEQFREKVFIRFGMRKGNINKAVKEAITDWINKEGEKKSE